MDNERPWRRQDSEDEPPRYSRSDRDRYRNDDRDDDRYDDRYDDRDRYREYELPHRGGMILTLGIIGLVVGLVICPIVMVLGFVAWFMGTADLRKMDQGIMDPSGRGNTVAGKVMGIITSILFILYLLFIGVIVALFASGVLK
jgi:hypothetical protein